MSEKNSSAKPKRFKGWELLVATALCVVVAVIFFSGFSGFDFGTSGKSASTDDFEAYRKNLESKVKEVVCAIEGAGKVEVAITFDGTVERVYAYETKTTSSGSVTEIVFANGAPVVIKEEPPVVKGVVIVAGGADNAVVKLNILRAVTVLLDVDYNRIEIIKYK